MENQSQAHQAKIQNLIDNGYNFRMGDYISEGIEIFKQNMGGFVLFTLAYLAIVVGLSFIPFVGSIGVSVISGALATGFYVVARKVRYGGVYEFSDFFKGFDKLMPLFLTGLIGGLVTMVGLICLIIPGIYLAVAFSMAIPMVWFFDYEFWPALDTSRKVITKNWWAMFGFFFVLGLINLLGILCLGIGVLFTMPITQLAMYAAFDDIFKPEEQGQGQGSQFDDLTSHLVDEQ